MTKIKKITVSNLKAVSNLSADFNGCTAIITGKNNSGKTSFLRALADRMRGIKSDKVVKVGEKEGFYEMELTDGSKLVWEFTNHKEKLTLISEKQIKSSVTKDICQYYFPKVFDVDSFLNETPKKQREQIQRICGIDFSDIEKKFKAAYEERTFANRNLEEAKARRIMFEVHWKEKFEKTDYDANELLEKEYHSVGEHNLNFKTIQDKTKGFISRRNQLSDEIIELRKKIGVLELEDVDLQMKIEKGTVWTGTAKNKPKDDKTVNDLHSKLDDFLKNKAAIESEQKYEKRIIEAKAADEEVKKIEKDKIDALKSSTLPEGFSFTEEGVTYNGFEFTRSQLSTSGVYIGALKLAAMSLGDVRTLHFDASYLDKFSLAEIEKWAADNDLQLLIERPDFEGGEVCYEIIENVA